MTQQQEFDYYISPDGKTYSFHDRRSRRPAGRWLDVDADGLGMPEITYVTQRGPFQHGETALDYRLQPRTIAYIHRRATCTRSEFWDARAEILDALRPNRQAAGTFALGHLRKILPDGSRRDIDAMIMSGPAFSAQSSGNRDTRGFVEALKFYCPDPTFYDPTQVVVELTSGFCSGLEFPFEFPFEFCESYQYVTHSYTYPGTWLTYPIITIFGPVWHMVIANITTGEILDLPYEILVGESVEFDLRYGYKTVKDNRGNNLVGYLSSDSDLATFHLAPDPEAPGGVNQLSVTGYESSTPPGARATMRYYTRYIGI